MIPILRPNPELAAFISSLDRSSESYGCATASSMVVKYYRKKEQ